MPSRNRHREARRRPASAETTPPLPARNGEAAPGVVTVSRRAPDGVRRLPGPGDAEALARHLLDPERRWPVAVVSIPSALPEPLVDVADLAEAVRGIAEVVVLPTDATSWRLSELLPPMTQVYGGAGRVYPVGLDWTRNPSASPLRFCFTERESARATDRLVSDALAMGARHVDRDVGETGPAVAGVVAALVPPSRGMVTLDGGGLATVWQELTAPDVPLEQLLACGMRVEGRLDPDTRRLDLTTALLAGPEAVAPYGTGDVVLARVQEVRPDVVHLALHPDVVVPVVATAVTGNPKDRLTDLFTPGETVVARVASRTDDRIGLRLDDLDDEDEPLRAPALLDGGPPWLVPPPDPEVLAAQDEPATTAALPIVVPVGEPLATVPGPRGAVRDLSLTLDAAKAELRRLESELAVALTALRPAETERDALRRQVADLIAEQQRLREQVERQRTQLRQRATNAARLNRGDISPEDDAPAFLDPVEQIRHEIYLQWVTRIPAADKPHRPLRDYTLGPRFLASLDALEGVSRRKVLDVVVEVLTGLAEQSSGRELHRLRSGPSGDAPPVTRADGAVAWRVALQRNTPAARRLHFWRLGDRIELSRVVHHDDMEP